MFGLGFLAPAFLTAALAIGVPILLHLYRRRSDRVVEFPAAHMLEPVPVAQQERRTLRDLLLLALRVAALLLLALSFARPYVARGSASLPAPVTMVVIDTSMSMSGDVTWRAATEAALNAVAAAPATHRVGVVSFDDRAQVAVEPTSDRAAARAYLEALEPGAGGTRFAPAITAAVEAIGPAGGRIVVVSDLQQSGLDGAEAAGVPEGVELSVTHVPAASANLSVTTVARDDSGATAVIQSYAPGPRVVTARLLAEGVERGRARVELAAFASVEVSLQGALPTTGVAEVVIDDADGWRADNTRYLGLEPQRARTVAVLTAGPPEATRTGLYVQRALEAAGDDRIRVAVVDGRRFSALLAEDAPAAVFVIGTRTLDRAGRAGLAAYLSGGGRVFLSLGPDVDVATLADALGMPLRLAPEPVSADGDAAVIVPADRRHPVLRQLTGVSASLARVQVEQYRRVLDESGWTILARAAGGAMMMGERQVGRGTLLTFASDLDNRWNRFPVQPTFAPFVVEAYRYLTSDTDVASAYVLPAVPQGVPPVPGAHRLASGTAASDRLVIVNVDPKESDPAVVSVDTFTAGLRPVERPAPARDADQARTREDQQRLWQIGLLLMLVVLVIESLVGRASRVGPGPEPRVG